MSTINYSISIRSARPGVKKVNVKATKAFPVLQSKGTLTLDDLAQHISEHGSKYSRGDLKAVVSELTDCAREFLLDGKHIQLGELGTLRPVAKVVGADTAADCDSTCIKSLTVGFRPGKPLRSLLEDAQFEHVPTVAAQADAKTAAKSQETLQDEDDGQHLGD